MEKDAEIGEAEDVLSIDEALSKYVGEFGRGQIIHFTLVSTAWALEALHTLVTIFADQKPQWRCKSQYNSISMVTDCSSSSSICDLSTDSWDWIGGFEASTVSEFGLICNQSHKVGLVQSIFFVGSMLGAGLFGSLADSSLGRKGVLCVACFLSGFFGFCTAFAPNFWIYFICRFLTGVSAGGVGLSSFVLATEPVGPSKRGIAGMSALYFFSFGTMLLSAIAYLSPSWRLLYIFTSLPSILYCISVLPWISESPRWYLVHGKSDKALTVLRALAKRNLTQIPDKGVRLSSSTSSSSEEEEKSYSGSIVDVLRERESRTRLIVMSIIWFCCSVVYYGVSLNVVNIGFNLYLSVFFNALAEAPAFAITAFFLDKLGRKMMLLISMVMSGACCIVGSTLYIVNEGAKFRSIGGLMCGVASIFGMAGTFNLVYIYTVELFPTVVRNAALGHTTQAGQLGAIMAPLFVVLANVHPALPFGIFGVAGIAGGLLGFKLPETLDQPLWDTLEAQSKSLQHDAGLT